ncbi:MAG: hypothetical protein HQL24_03900 [Candidatus Omnitrophica bacterium]|nr:hypothetical protein [Candidatus Omnitrophota bacterium]
MKKILIILGIVSFSLIFITIVKDLIIKSVVTVVATNVTGAPVHIDSFSVGIFHPTIRISGFKLYNPNGFSKDVLISCPKINVTYDLAALLKQKLHLSLVELELQEMGLAKNKDGKLNVDSLKVVKQPDTSKPLPLQIDKLTLGIGKIVSKDYTGKDPEPDVRVYDVNIHKTYKNITSVQQLAVLILAEPLKSAGIKGAQVYGVAMLAGMAILPVGIAATFAGNDSVKQDFNAGVDQAYAVSLDVLKRMGNVAGQSATKGEMKANVKGADVVLKIKKTKEQKTEITVSARKYMLPAADIAGGVLYEISQKLQ